MFQVSLQKKRIHEKSLTKCWNHFIAAALHRKIHAMIFLRDKILVIRKNLPFWKGKNQVSRNRWHSYFPLDVRLLLMHFFVNCYAYFALVNVSFDVNCKQLYNLAIFTMQHFAWNSTKMLIELKPISNFTYNFSTYHARQTLSHDNQAHSNTS